jgi:hypothetical protein
VHGFSFVSLNSTHSTLSALCPSAVFPSLSSLRVHVTWSLFRREITPRRNPYHFQRTNRLTILDCLRSYFYLSQGKKGSMHKMIPRWNHSSSHSAMRSIHFTYCAPLHHFFLRHHPDFIVPLFCLLHSAAKIWPRHPLRAQISGISFNATCSLSMNHDHFRGTIHLITFVCALIPRDF